MTAEQFNNEFDTLLNSYATNWAFGEDMSKADIRLDIYEKSLLLTEAQEELVVSLYTGRNSSGNSFDETEELRRYLSPLVKEVSLEPENEGIPMGVAVTADTTSHFFTLPEDAWYIVYETVKVSSTDNCVDGKMLDVVPVTHDEYNRVRRNPFRGPNGRKVLRLDVSEGTAQLIEIISKYNVTSYRLRYLERPTPIVLGNLDGLEVNGETTATECQLPTSLHRRILEIAVIKALQSRNPRIQSNN